MFYHLNPTAIESTAIESTAIVMNTIALLELLVTKHFANFQNSYCEANMAIILLTLHCTYVHSPS